MWKRFFLAAEVTLGSFNFTEKYGHNHMSPYDLLRSRPYTDAGDILKTLRIPLHRYVLFRYISGELP